MSEDYKWKFSLDFIVPAERVMEIARKMLASESQDERDVAKAMLDFTEVTIRTEAEMKRGIEENWESYDLAPYFDHFTGDATEAAQRLLKSDDDDVKDVAQCLLDQEKAVTRSKQSFMKDILAAQGAAKSQDIVKEVRKDVAQNLGTGFMRKKPQKVTLNFQLTVPTDAMLDVAKRMVASTSQDLKDVGKAVLDLTEVTVKTMAKIHAKEHCDLHEYFDHFTGDASEAAERLLMSKDKDVKEVAKLLLNQEKAVHDSKKSFVSEAKRVGAKPKFKEEDE